MNKKGFTLIELLVVVIIIAILAAIALPRYMKAVERSRTSEANTLIGTINHAQTIFHIQNPPDYATYFSQLDINITSGTISNGTLTTDNFVYTLGNDRITAARRNASYPYTLGLIYENEVRCCDNGEGSSLDICSPLGISQSCE